MPPCGGFVALRRLSCFSLPCFRSWQPPLSAFAPFGSTPLRSGRNASTGCRVWLACWLPRFGFVTVFEPSHEVPTPKIKNSAKASAQAPLPVGFLPSAFPWQASVALADGSHFVPFASGATRSCLTHCTLRPHACSGLFFLFFSNPQGKEKSKCSFLGIEKKSR